MKTKILFLICIAASAIQLFAQEKYYKQKLFLPDKYLTTDQYIDWMDHYPFDFTPPKRFIESQLAKEDVLFVFPRTIPSNAYLALLSKDKQCMVAYSGRYGSGYVSQDFETAQTTIAQAQACFARRTFLVDLQNAYGLDIKLNDHLTVNSGEKAEKQFNADSVYIYSVPIKNEELKPYTHGVCMMTFRFPNHLVGIYLFLTDKGYKNLDKYVSKINGSIQYRDLPKNPYGDLYKTKDEINYLIKN